MSLCSSRARGGFLVAALCLALSLPGRAEEAAPASPPPALAEGVRLIQAGDPERALEHLQAAPAEDLRVPFFTGVALNRLGRFAEAAAALERARAGGLDHPDLPFELGWSLLGQERFEEALAQLEAFEAARPGRGQTSEFLGRCWFGLQRDEEAARAFEEALSRDPGLASSVQPYQAALAERQGDREGSRAILEAWREAYGSTPLAVQLGRTGLAQARVGVASPEKPYRVSLALGAGGNSNVIALPDDFILPGTISGQSSSVTQLSLDGSYHWFLNEDQDNLYLGYAGNAEQYSQVSAFNPIDHTLYAGYRAQVGEGVFASGRGGLQLTSVGGTPFRRAWQFRPSFAARQGDWGVIEGAVSVTSSEFFSTFAPSQDRDSTAITTSLVQSFFPPGTRLEGRVGLFHTWNNSVGDDFDLQSDGFLVGLSHPVVGDTMLDLGWQHSFDRYSRNNSLAGPFGFAFPRKDDFNQVSAQLRHPLVRDAGWESGLYLRWSRASNVSNIPFYGYSRSAWTGGVQLNF